MRCNVFHPWSAGQSSCITSVACRWRRPLRSFPHRSARSSRGCPAVGRILPPNWTTLRRLAMGSDDEVVVDRELATLEDVSTGTRPWLEPAELRRRGRNRRLRRRGGVVGAALAVAVLVATLVPIGFGGRTNPNGNLHVAARFGPAIQLVSDTGHGGPVSAGPSSNVVARAEQ